MIKTTISAAAFIFAISGAALAQTSVQGSGTAGARAGSCTTVLADLEDQVGSLAGTVGGAVDSVGSSVGSVAGGLGLGASAGSQTPVGSAGASAEASSGAAAEAPDLAAVSTLFEDARDALASGDEQQCLELAAQARHSLSASTR